MQSKRELKFASYVVLWDLSFEFWFLMYIF